MKEKKNSKRYHAILLMNTIEVIWKDASVTCCVAGTRCIYKRPNRMKPRATLA